MIVLIIICALGLSGIALLQSCIGNNYSSYDATGDYQETIDCLKNTNGDPNEIANVAVSYGQRYRQR